MSIVAGIDEAGYGPVLGPLVVSRAVFRVARAGVRPAAVDAAAPEGEADPDAGAEAPDLWSRFGERTVLRAPPVQPRGARRSADRDERLVVCDSKKIYNGGKGLRRMEESVLCFLAAAGPDGLEGLLDGQGSLSALLGASGHAAGTLEPYPWYHGRDIGLPRFAFKTVLRRQAAALRRALAASGIEMVGLTPRVVHPLEFNGGVRREGNKHLFEWAIVASFLREIFDRHAAEGADVCCDKLGGRDFYGPLLARLFPEARVTAPLESGERSVYLVTRGARRMTVTFLVEGDDRSFPVALASCCSKYVRELFMHLMNSFFTDRLPGLRETAGYSGDGQRFAEAVRDEMRRLDLDERLLVRCC